MKTEKVLLNSMEEIQEFNRIVGQYEYEVDMISGRYVIDGKSLMGILSLDLSRPVTIQMQGTPDEEFLDKLKKFIVEE